VYKLGGNDRLLKFVFEKVTLKNCIITTNKLQLLYLTPNEEKKGWVGGHAVASTLFSVAELRGWGNLWFPPSINNIGRYSILLTKNNEPGCFGLFRHSFFRSFTKYFI